MLEVISVRTNPAYASDAIAYIQASWDEVNPIIYEDCIRHCLTASHPLPQWYILLKNQEIIGCAGLITNDFISRMDLYPWLCALFINESERGNAYAKLLLDYAKDDTQRLGFTQLNLCTAHIGFYEKYGYTYIGEGHHPWGESSRIYQLTIHK